MTDLKPPAVTVQRATAGRQMDVVFLCLHPKLSIVFVVKGVPVHAVAAAAAARF